MMRVTTLKATAEKLSGLLAYYAGLAEDRDRPGLGRGPVDYYLDPDEPPGRWWGGGRQALGLDGTVEGADLRELLDARRPGTGERLGRRFGNSSARGFDTTFSAPKSVSVLWALSPDPWVRAEVLAAHEAAIEAALGWFEHHGAVTRRGTDGVFQVDSLGAEHDGAEPDHRIIASLERDAARTSRPGKGHGIDALALRADWAEEARSLGFEPDHLTSGEIAGDRWPERVVSDYELIDEALRRTSNEASTWLRADVARHLVTLIGPNRAPDAAALVLEIDRLAARAELRCTGLAPERTDTTRYRKDGRPVTEHVTDRRYTNPAVLRQEQDLQTWATSAVGTVAPTGDPQGAAARAIAGHAPLVVVVGPAGTGKTHTTAGAVAAMRAQGRPVVGLAPSGKAADVLGAEAHCPTDTVAGFLIRHRSGRSPWPEGTTVILDEAGMMATADLARLVALVPANRWRLVTVGDPEQLTSVVRGGVFAHWCETVPHHTLDTPRRFTQP